MKFVLAIAAALVGMMGSGVPAAGADWKDLPVIPSINGSVKDSLRRDLARNLRSGGRAGTFAKVGDSNTEMPSALYGLGCRRVKLDGRRWLKPTLRRYNEVKLMNERPMPGCLSGTSFSRRSAAAKSATLSNWSLIPVRLLPNSGLWEAPVGCFQDETPLSCEMRIIRPRFVLIMTGTNDVQFDRSFDSGPGVLTGASLKLIIKEVRKQGGVPVVSTLPPLLKVGYGPDAIDPYNQQIVRSARGLGAPVINLWRGLTDLSMINQGVEPGGIHLATSILKDSAVSSPEPNTITESVDFRPDRLRFGANLRNLIWLKTLARLDRAAASISLRDN